MYLYIYGVYMGVCMDYIESAYGCIYGVYMGVYIYIYIGPVTNPQCRDFQQGIQCFV